MPTLLRRVHCGGGLVSIGGHLVLPRVYQHRQMVWPRPFLVPANTHLLYRCRLKPTAALRKSVCPVHFSTNLCYPTNSARTLIQQMIIHDFSLFLLLRRKKPLPAHYHASLAVYHDLIPYVGLTKTGGANVEFSRTGVVCLLGVFRLVSGTL
jgi:hypothetical protein